MAGGVSYKTTDGSNIVNRLDDLEPGADGVAQALSDYLDLVDVERHGSYWARAMGWIQNIIFSSGRHYVNDILSGRLTNSNSDGVGDISIAQDAARNIPKPTNDILGRYVETNISLLTENRPRPRVTPKSDKDEDETSAALSEIVLEYYWEALKSPQKHRDIARMILHTGVAFLEIGWDPTIPRKVQIPATREERQLSLPEGASMPLQGGVGVQTRLVPIVDKEGNTVMEEEIQYGEVYTNVVSPFQLHFPLAHDWYSNDVNWVIKEEYVSVTALKDRYNKLRKRGAGFTKAQGWHLNILDSIEDTKITNLALWYWDRLAGLVEGPGPTQYFGSADNWAGYTIVRTFDRAPCTKWPKGRSIITVGSQLLYDSPKEVGARAYDPRWPERWHPYIRFRWEAQIASIYGRSLVSKLLPYIKRINSIDTTLIMWRRTVPIAQWVAPKGTVVTEDLWSGVPGTIVEYDPRKTAGAAPSPIYPPNYPAAALEEKQYCYNAMEQIAGTEQILRGERPPGVNSAAMIDIMRRQALASRSPTLQEWDECLEEEGTLLLQVAKRYVKNDPGMVARLRIIAREKHSTLAIEDFSGQDLSDNVVVKVDTASLALASKEAREAKMIEVLQYLPNVMAIDDIGLRQAILDELGLKKALMPSGPDVNRAKKMISLIKQGRAAMVYMLQEDDPQIYHALLVNEMKSDGFLDLPQDQQQAIIQLAQVYMNQIKLRMLAQQKQMEQAMAMQAAAGGKPGAA